MFLKVLKKRQGNSTKNMSHILFHFQYTYYYIVKVLYPTLQTQWTSHAIERISSSKLDQNLFRMISCVTKCFLTSTPLGKIWSFSRRISSENVIRSAVSCEFGNIIDEILDGKIFLCVFLLSSNQSLILSASSCFSHAKISWGHLKRGSFLVLASIAKHFKE